MGDYANLEITHLEVSASLTKVKVGDHDTKEVVGDHSGFTATLSNDMCFKIEQWAIGSWNDRRNLVKVYPQSKHPPARKTFEIKMPRRHGITLEKFALEMLHSLENGGDFKYKFETNSCLTSVLKPCISLGLVDHMGFD